MTQYDERVQRQRDKLEAEEWAKGVKWIHVHRLKSMWYDDRPQDTDDGSVTDTMYNSGLIVRTRDGKHIHTFGEALKGDDLVYEWGRYNPNG
tara:strand:+ start:711 stop:986 length:276 start_codon:yes stop_codon:yes gene_type:complete